MLSILSAQDKPLSAADRSRYKRYSQSGEINFQVEDKDAKIRELAEHYKKGQIDYLDGITIDFGDWWFNVRKSNTEPLLRLNLEARTARDAGGEAQGAEAHARRAGARALNNTRFQLENPLGRGLFWPCPADERTIICAA